MSADDVKMSILSAFNLDDYEILAATRGGKFSVAVCQNPTGDVVIEKNAKSPLYICEKVIYFTACGNIYNNCMYMCF